MEKTVQSSLLKAAELIATLAHQGQYDEDGVPYIKHPAFVASLLETTEEKIVGYLHDTIEDTCVTEADLRPIFGDRITDAVVLMTHDKSVPYFDYVEKLSHNALARRVKLADLTHNMDLGRAITITEKQLTRTEKYHKAYDMLMEIEKQSSKV